MTRLIPLEKENANVIRKIRSKDPLKKKPNNKIRIMNSKKVNVKSMKHKKEKNFQQ